MKIVRTLRRLHLAAAAVVVATLSLLGMSWRAFDGDPQAAGMSRAGASHAFPPAPRSAQANPEQAATPASGPALATRTPTPSAISSTDAALTQALRSGALQVLVRDDFSRQQVAVRHVVCEDRRCAMQLQIPPFAEAAIRQDFKVASDLLDALRTAYKDQGAEVALTELSQSEEGMRIALHIDATSQQGRLMTGADIAKIRAETLTAYLNAQQASGVQGRATPGGRHAP